MRLYSLQHYDQFVDLDGYAFETELKIGMIISLTLCQKELEEPQEIKESIEKDHGITVHSLPKLAYSEEVFFKIVSILGKDKFEIEFYDWFSNGHIYLPLSASRFHYYATQSREMYNRALVEEYEAEVEKQRKINKQSRTATAWNYKAIDLDDLAHGRTTITEIIERRNFSYFDVRHLLRDKYIDDTQFKTAQQWFQRKHQNTYRQLVPHQFDPKEIKKQEFYEQRMGGETQISRWLKVGDKITCHLREVHYVPIQANKLKEIGKPYAYQFYIISHNEIRNWSGETLDDCVLDLLQPGDMVRAEFNLIDLATNQQGSGWCGYFKIITVSDDWLFAVLTDTYNNCPQLYPEIQHIFGNLLTFRKRNISEIPLTWTENKKLREFKLIKKGFEYAATGSGYSKEGIVRATEVHHC